MIVLGFSSRGTSWLFVFPLISEDSADGGLLFIVSGKTYLVADGQWLPGGSGLFLLLRPSGFFWGPFHLKHMYLFLLFYPRKASSHHQAIHREKLALTACWRRWLDLYFLVALWKLGQDVVDLMAAPRDSCSPLFRVSVGRGPTGFLLYSEQTFGKLCSVPDI